MSAAENSPRNRKTGLSRVKNGVIFHKATIINMEVTWLANSLNQRSTHRMEKNRNRKIVFFFLGATASGLIDTLSVHLPATNYPNHIALKSTLANSFD